MEQKFSILGQEINNHRTEMGVICNSDPIFHYGLKGFIDVFTLLIYISVNTTI